MTVKTGNRRNHRQTGRRTMLTSALFEQRLVDQLLPPVSPVLLGRGKHFLSDSIAPRNATL